MLASFDSWMWKKWINVYFTCFLISIYVLVRGEISPYTYVRRKTSLTSWMCRLQFCPFSLSTFSNTNSWTTIYSSMRVILTDDMSPCTCDITYWSQSFLFFKCVLLCVPFRFSFSLLYLFSLVLHPETRARSRRPIAIHYNMHSKACVLCIYQ